MKATKFVNLLAMGLALTFAVGCKRKPTPLTLIPNRPTVVGNNDTSGMIPANPGGNDQATGVSANPPESHMGWTEDHQTLAGDTVHFDYDSSVVKSSEESKVSAVAEYLKGAPAAAVKIEGHCDERGTDEYNRSLGDRRAMALREKLVTLGIDATRVDTISYGKDRPIDTGHSKESHAKNRRGEFVVLTK